MYYIGNCNNMWIDIKQMEDEIKLREPLYQNNLMKKSKPIYDKSFGISIIYFCILMIIITQKSMKVELDTTIKISKLIGQ